MKTTKFQIDPNDLYNYRAKRAARLAVFYAIEDGELVRPEICEVCDCTHSEMQAHHTNYGDPLNVIWVCPPCHARIHADKKHELNPANHEQTILASVQKNITYAKVEVTLPIENYLLIKDRAQRYGIKVEDHITRSLVRTWPVRTDIKGKDDDAREQHFERISSLVENETELPAKELPRLPQSWGEGDNVRSGVERFYSVSARHGGDADGL